MKRIILIPCFFCDILTSFNLVQHVGEATHESGHFLDLVLTRPTDFVSNVLVGDLSSDHKIVTFNLQIGKVLPEKIKVNSRNYKGIDITKARHYFLFRKCCSLKGIGFG